MTILKHFTVLFLALSLLSCNNDDDENGPDDENSSSNAISYYPITIGNSWTYENIDAQGIISSSFTQEVSSETIDSIGNTYRVINTIDNGIPRFLFSARVDNSGRTIFLTASFNFNSDPSQPLIVTPFELPNYLASDNVGRSFEFSSRISETMNSRNITILEENDISLEINDLQFDNVIRVRSNVFSNLISNPSEETLSSFSDAFYAPNIGLIRSIFFDANGNVTFQRDITDFTIL